MMQIFRSGPQNEQKHFTKEEFGFHTEKTIRRSIPALSFPHFLRSASLVRSLCCTAGCDIHSSVSEV